MDGNTINIPSAERVLSFLALLIFSSLLHAGSNEAIRIQVASRIFPSMVAADQSIDRKVNSNGELLILVLYERVIDNAIAAEREIAATKTIHKFPITVQLASIDTLMSFQDKRIAALFVSERLDSNLNGVIEFGKKQGIITFSPYSSDVNRGVAGGIMIQDRIIPYVNLDTLRASSITLHPFFIKVAKTYALQ